MIMSVLFAPLRGHRGHTGCCLCTGLASHLRNAELKKTRLILINGLQGNLPDVYLGKRQYFCYTAQQIFLPSAVEGDMFLSLKAVRFTNVLEKREKIVSAFVQKMHRLKKDPRRRFSQH